MPKAAAKAPLLVTLNGAVTLARSAPLAVKQASGMRTDWRSLPARRWNSLLASSGVPQAPLPSPQAIAIVTLPAGAACTRVSKRSDPPLAMAAGSARGRLPCVS